MLWTLCLTNPQGRKIVQLEPTTSLQALYAVTEEQYGTPVATLKYGFPPQELPRSTNDTHCIQDVLQNQERIQVELKEIPSTSTTTKPEPPKNNNRSRTTRPPQRSAAQRATEQMPAMIRAQEELLEGQTKATKKRPRTTTSTARTTQHPKPPSSSSPARFHSSVGEGRRLADGVSVGPPPTTTRQGNRTRSTTRASQKSNDDMSEALLGALNDSGKMGQVLRKGMKNAVRTSYETSRAFSRLAAIQAKTYTMTQQQQQETASSLSPSSSLTVLYQGSIDKTKTTETVDCIPRTVLEEVLKGIYATNPEALRPENLSLLSPRVLWSLVYIFPTHNTFNEIYHELLPDLNWSFLRRRAQQLSEKALENLRQQQQQGEEEVEDGEHALEAIAAVEHAMEHLHEHTAAERKARLARAAISRLNTMQETALGEEGEWKLITPDEPDADELRECILASENPTRDISTLITKLMGDCKIHNWRELANVPDAAWLAKMVGEPIEFVQSWIEYAQGRSVEEIIVEICNGNVRAVELLTEQARSGTPKDLAAWRSIPSMLHQFLDGHEDAPNKDDLQTWSQRAYQLLNQCEWLNWYATPVE